VSAVRSGDPGNGAPPSAVARAADLRRLIEEHNRRYYVDDAPAISDAEYDALFRELEALEARHPGLASPESPTQRVGGAARTDFAPVRHAVPMLSIRTETDTIADAAAKFDARVRRDLGLAADAPPVEYLAELKFDGPRDQLEIRRGSARGSGHPRRRRGRRGRHPQCPHHPLHTQAVARHAPAPLLEVRGEVYMTRRAFEELNARQQAAGGKRFINPRNTAAGACGRSIPR
jgi:DNA ligase (NAD+)